MWISKSYTDADFHGNPTPDQKIEIFRDRVMGWQIDIAKEMVRQIETTTRPDVMNHAGYAVLSVLTSYFEMYWQYKQGVSSDHQSAHYFALGFAEVYPTFPMSHADIKDKVYKWLRCGMYHDGFTKRGVTIDSRYTQDCDYDATDDELKINPHSMVATIENRFAGFIATLKVDAAARGRFLRIFDQYMPTPPTASSPTATTPGPAPTPSLPHGSESGVRRP